MRQDIVDGILKAKTHYDALLIEQKATVLEIRDAYKKLILKYHPDKNKDSRAASVFQRLGDAYTILSDDAKRANYDKSLAKEGSRRAILSTQDCVAFKELAKSIIKIINPLKENIPVLSSGGGLGTSYQEIGQSAKKNTENNLNSWERENFTNLITFINDALRIALQKKEASTTGLGLGGGRDKMYPFQAETSYGDYQRLRYEDETIANFLKLIKSRDKEVASLLSQYEQALKFTIYWNQGRPANSLLQAKVIYDENGDIQIGFQQNYVNIHKLNQDLNMPPIEKSSRINSLLEQEFAKVRPSFVDKPVSDNSFEKKDNPWHNKSINVNLQHVLEIFIDKAAIEEASKIHKEKALLEYRVMCLKSAIEEGGVEAIVKIIADLDGNGLGVNRLEQECSYHPLFHAIEKGRGLDVIRLLLSKGCLPKNEMLYSAAKYCALDVVDFLYTALKSPDLNNIRGNYNNETPLHGAIRKIEATFEIPIFNQDGAFKMARCGVEMQQERLNVVGFLMQKGASPYGVYDAKGVAPIALCIAEDEISKKVKAIADKYVAGIDQNAEIKSPLVSIDHEQLFREKLEIAHDLMRKGDSESSEKFLQVLTCYEDSTKSVGYIWEDYESVAICYAILINGYLNKFDNVSAAQQKNLLLQVIPKIKTVPEFVTKAIKDFQDLTKPILEIRGDPRRASIPSILASATFADPDQEIRAKTIKLFEELSQIKSLEPLVKVIANAALGIYENGRKKGPPLQIIVSKDGVGNSEGGGEIGGFYSPEKNIIYLNVGGSYTDRRNGKVEYSDQMLKGFLAHEMHHAWDTFKSDARFTDCSAQNDNVAGLIAEAAAKSGSQFLYVPLSTSIIEQIPMAVFSINHYKDKEREITVRVSHAIAAITGFIDKGYNNDTIVTEEAAVALIQQSFIENFRFFQQESDKMLRFIGLEITKPQTPRAPFSQPVNEPPAAHPAVAIAESGTSIPTFRSIKFEVKFLDEYFEENEEKIKYKSEITKSPLYGEINLYEIKLSITNLEKTEEKTFYLFKKDENYLIVGEEKARTARLDIAGATGEKHWNNQVAAFGDQSGLETFFSACILKDGYGLFGRERAVKEKEPSGSYFSFITESDPEEISYCSDSDMNLVQYNDDGSIAPMPLLQEYAQTIVGDDGASLSPHANKIRGYNFKTKEFDDWLAKKFKDGVITTSRSSKIYRDIKSFIESDPKLKKDIGVGLHNEAKIKYSNHRSKPVQLVLPNRNGNLTLEEKDLARAYVLKEFLETVSQRVSVVSYVDANFKTNKRHIFKEDTVRAKSVYGARAAANSRVSVSTTYSARAQPRAAPKEEEFERFWSSVDGRYEAKLQVDHDDIKPSIEWFRGLSLSVKKGQEKINDTQFDFEKGHHWVQIIFPTAKVGVNKQAMLLSKDLCKWFEDNTRARINFSHCFEDMMNLYGLEVVGKDDALEVKFSPRDIYGQVTINGFTYVPSKALSQNSDHNLQRLTRVMTSCWQLGFFHEAAALRECLITDRRIVAKVNVRSKQLWELALINAQLEIEWQELSNKDGRGGYAEIDQIRISGGIKEFLDERKRIQQGRTQQEQEVSVSVIHTPPALPPFAVQPAVQPTAAQQQVLALGGRAEEAAAVVVRTATAATVEAEQQYGGLRQESQASGNPQAPAAATATATVPSLPTDGVAEQRLAATVAATPAAPAFIPLAIIAANGPEGAPLGDSDHQSRGIPSTASSAGKYVKTSDENTINTPLFAMARAVGLCHYYLPSDQPDKSSFSTTNEEIQNAIERPAEERPTGPELNTIIAQFLNKAISRSKISPEHVEAIIGIAIKNGGIGNDRAKKADKDLKDLALQKKIPDLKQFIIQAKKFSAEFQMVCSGQSLYTGNLQAKKFVGMRLKRINEAALPEIMIKLKELIQEQARDNLGAREGLPNAAPSSFAVSPVRQNSSSQVQQ